MPESRYKPLARGGRPAFGGVGRYALPVAGAPGPWLPDLGWVVPFARGYHLCTPDTLWPWLHEELYAAEGRGACIAVGGTWAYSSVRLLCRLRWRREDALQLFDEQLADLEERCGQDEVPLPSPYRHADATWQHLRQHIASAERWYRAFAVATERVIAVMAGLSHQQGVPGDDGCLASRERAERHVRTAFFAHVHGSAPADGSRRRSA